MAVKLRLQRFGAKKNPQYRIVACDSKSPRDGSFLEIVGSYNPATNPATIKVDTAKAVKWLDCGAQPTVTVKQLFASQNIKKTKMTKE